MKLDPTGESHQLLVPSVFCSVSREGAQVGAGAAGSGDDYTHATLSTSSPAGLLVELPFLDRPHSIPSEAKTFSDGTFSR